MCRVCVGCVQMLERERKRERESEGRESNRATRDTGVGIGDAGRPLLPTPPRVVSVYNSKLCV